VIAYRGGGALDTVIPGRTGVLFDEMTVDSLAAALESFDASAYDPAALRAHAEQFDTQVFNRQISEYVERAYASFRLQA
jgi:glycosyltransferase involved in cell wall biosynthesis